MPRTQPVLLVMDFQHGIVERSGNQSALDAAGRAVEAARQAVVTTTDEWIQTL
ncbi:MAG TPA: hypothetical protein VFR35_18360 [Actinoplanes sp.]|nr:hypothetical protein [Actinoplanes sp.]